MLGFYFKTIIFWVIVMFCSLIVCAHKIKENGWCDRSQPYTPQKALFLLCCICAIPLMRFLFVIIIYMMANMTPDELNKWLDK